MYGYDDPGTPWGAIIGLSLLGLAIWGGVVFAAVYGALVVHDGRPGRIAEKAAAEQRMRDAAAARKAKRQPPDETTTP